ncbi:MAG TPA: L,D-transpeptidase family protein [Vicinamibacterales bacterium]|nr:L,D-transpeptidase family protein [Vicinamibacterales bacterium]
MRHLDRCAARFEVSSLIFSLILAGAGCSRAPSPEARAAHQQALRTVLEAKAPPPAYAAADDRGRHVWQEAQRFYKQNGYALAWSDGRTPRPQMDGLIRAVRAADQEGLEPAEYGADELDRIRQTFDPSHAADTDVRFTYTYLRYASDLTHGTFDPEIIDPHWHAAKRGADVHAALERGLADNRVEDSLQKLTPPAPQYQGLKHQLTLARFKGAPPETILQIAMNMDRWRWLPDDLGSRYLMVNIPAFRLDAIENGKSVLEMKVVTGKKDSPTPVLADEMTTVVFSPYWNIPSEIVSKEILPKLETDPSYLERNNIELDESGQRYRQRPGKGNSLGQVKFLFPNHFNVYLHDTPAGSLFARIERDFSHGCVRLERPLDLAKYVLRDQPEWTDERIVAAMNRGVEQSVALKQALPIYLVYFTAWEENGRLETRPDVYGLDRRHVRAADQ